MSAVVWPPYHANAGSSGLRVRYDSSLHPFIRREMKTFCRWLRWYYHFPVPVRVYICHADHIRARDGDLCDGTCFQSAGPDETVCIHIAAGIAGDVPQKQLQDRLWGCIFTLAHELTHYYQYISSDAQSHRGMEWQATWWANRIQDLYYTDEWDDIDSGWSAPLPTAFHPPKKEYRPTGRVL